MKQTKSIGITKACPKCRKIVVFKADYKGEGSEEMKCPYCQIRLLKSVNQNTHITLSIIIIILAFFLTLTIIARSNDPKVADQPQYYEQ